MNLDDLKPAPYNPRTIDEPALAALETSLHAFGDISGITWNKRNGHLVTGHQRMKLLRQKYGDKLTIDDGSIHVPTGERFPVRVVDWPDAKEKAANIAANSPLLAGQWAANLPVVLGEIKTAPPDLHGRLRMDALKALPPMPEPDDQTERQPTTVTCPECGHEFMPG